VFKLLCKLGVLGLMVTNAPLMFQRLYLFEWYGGSLRSWIKSLGLPQGSEILELGSGSGALTADMLNMGYQVKAVDSSQAMIKRAQHQIGDRDGLAFTLADALDLPFDSGRFDASIAASLLNVVPDKQRLLSEMTRVTKIGGSVSAFFPSESFTSGSAGAFARSNGLATSQHAAIEVLAGAARKLSQEDVIQVFERGGLVDIKTTQYLDRRLVSVTGTRIS